MGSQAESIEMKASMSQRSRKYRAQVMRRPYGYR
jgi:hypothetical protein